MGINMRVFILTGTLLLVQLSHQEAVPREGDGETTGINDGVCVPMTWDGEEGVLCTDDEYSWCATAVDDSGSYTTYDWCGYGSISGDSCVPIIWDGVWYQSCTNNGWCATSTYSNREWNSWKYCTSDDYDYEMDWPSEGADRSLDMKKMKKHAGRSLDRKK